MVSTFIVFLKLQTFISPSPTVYKMFMLALNIQILNAPSIPYGLQTVHLGPVFMPFLQKHRLSQQRSLFLDFRDIALSTCFVRIVDKVMCYR